MSNTSESISMEELYWKLFARSRQEEDDGDVIKVYASELSYCRIRQPQPLTPPNAVIGVEREEGLCARAEKALADLGLPSSREVWEMARSGELEVDAPLILCGKGILLQREYETSLGRAVLVGSPDFWLYVPPGWELVARASSLTLTGSRTETAVRGPALIPIEKKSGSDSYQKRIIGFAQAAIYAVMAGSPLGIVQYDDYGRSLPVAHRAVVVVPERAEAELKKGVESVVVAKAKGADAPSYCPAGALAGLPKADQLFLRKKYDQR